MSGSGSAGGGRPEGAFLRAAVLALALVAGVALPVAAALDGTAGVLGAAAALAFLAVLLGLSALMHVLAAPYGRRLWLGLTLGGLALRVGLYVALIVALGRVEALSPTALGLTAAFGIITGQVLEMRALVRARAHAPAPARPQAPAPAPPPAAGRDELEGVDR